VYGYAALEGEAVHIQQGRFVRNLHVDARDAPGVNVIETTVTDLIKCPLAHRMIRECALAGGDSVEQESFCADLVAIADGCLSNFWSVVLAGGG
jgi:squalene monooxygenase